MRLAHFEALRPICPLCRGRGEESPIAVQVVEEGDDDAVASGILGCASCGCEFPVLDGMPVIVPNMRQFIADNLFYLLARTDVPPLVESLLGDAAGASSGLQSIRQHVSSYAWDHWADHDPDELEPAPGPARPGGIARAVAAGLEMMSAEAPEGPILDIGCGAGRSIGEFAALTGRQVLGIDISIPLARVARRALIEGRVDYPRRRVGLVYDRREFPVPAAAPGLVDVWICDVQALPFRDGTFAMASAMNVIDCLAEPRAGLVEIDRALKPDGEAVFAVPFDWTGNVTAPEEWLGGHSQRAQHGGSAEALFGMLLEDGPLAAGSLRRVGAPREFPWHVRLHDRSCMHYSSYMVAARRVLSHNRPSDPA